MISGLRRLMLFILVGGLFSLVTASAWAQEFNPFVTNTFDIKHLSDQLELFQSQLQKSVGRSDIFLWGGTGRSFLGATLDNESLRLRDLDLGMDWTSGIDREQYSKIVQAAGEAFGADKVRSTRYEKLLLHGYADVTIIASSIRFDITVVTDKTMLNDRGIFDFDRIKVKIVKGKSLEDTRKEILTHGLTAARQSGIVIDPDFGFESWKAKDMRLNERWIQHTPWAELVMRAVRSYSKVGVTRIPDHAEFVLRQARAYPTLDQAYFDEESFFKVLFRVLSDPDPVPQLKEIARLDGFSKFSGALQKKISSSKLKFSEPDKLPLHAHRYLELVSDLAAADRANLYERFNRNAKGVEISRKALTCSGIFN